MIEKTKKISILSSLIFPPIFFTTLYILASQVFIILFPSELEEIGLGLG